MRPVQESFYRNAAVPQNDSNICLGTIIVLTKQTFVQLESTQSAKWIILSVYIFITIATNLAI